MRHCYECYVEQRVFSHSGDDGGENSGDDGGENSGDDGGENGGDDGGDDAAMMWR